MARLKRAEDGHFFILGGQSEGTWQIREKGIQWLQVNKYISDSKNDVLLDRGAYRFLKDNDYLFIQNVSYDRLIAPKSIENIAKPVPAGLPLFLQLKKQYSSAWTLKIELSGLRDDAEAWTEIQGYPTSSITIDAALMPEVTQQQLLTIPCWLNVSPQAFPYKVQRKDANHNKHALQQAPITSGLCTNYQGNVFVENKQSFGLKAPPWRRCLPESTLSFTGTVLWLAKTNWQHEWPGDAQHIDAPFQEWQLWKLSVSDTTTVTWDEIKQWFSYRMITVVHQHVQVQPLTPPASISDDGWFTCLPNTPLLLKCNSPRLPIKGVTQQSFLSAIAFTTSASQLDWASQANSAVLLAAQTSFFRWKPTRPGQYRIRLNGDTTTEPLLVSVNPAETPLPQWLHGINCTVMSEHMQQTFCAFQDSSTARMLEGKNILEQFTPEELAALQWTYEPEGLPIRVTWECSSEKGIPDSNLHFINSSSELTQYLQNHIGSSIAESTNASIRLDAGSFGLIELVLAPKTMQDDDEIWWSNEQLCAQLVWLSHNVQDNNVEPQVTPPTVVRTTLRQLSERTFHLPVLYRAMKCLASTDKMPAWILIRLQALLKDIQ